MTATVTGDDDGTAIDNRGKRSRGGELGRFVSASMMVSVFACLMYGLLCVFFSGTNSYTNKISISATQLTSSAAPKTKMTGYERLLQSEPEPEPEPEEGGDSPEKKDEDDVSTSKEDALVAKIAEKLKPVSLRFVGDEVGETEDGEVKIEVETVHKKDNDKKQTMLPHQFLHLHHMKTGGTSMDRLLRCSMDRLRKEANYDVPYYSIHECSRSRFAKCLTDKNNSCRASMNKAAVMSYCSALKYLEEFGWWENNNEMGNIKAFTVLRHPVDRVWSMFRFQTKNCFKCTPLKEIYKVIDETKDDPEARSKSGFDKLCLDQLQNHEVNNLLSTEWAQEVSEVKEDDHEMHDKMVQEAVENMKQFFTVIGITEELVETANIIGTVFPWMNSTVTGEDTSSSCTLPHANASPKNNRCGEGSTHWDLPDKPDQETYDLILKHNKMDMDLYEAAVAYFELQRRALGLI